MNKSMLIRPFCMVGVLLLAVLACVPGTGPVATEPPPVQDTVAPPVVAATTTPELQKYFTEEFNSEPAGQWSTFVVDTSIWRTSPASLPSFVEGTVDNMSVDVKDGRLAFDLEDKYLYVYDIYDSQDYDDVRVDVVAENRGTSNNNVSLICRYSKEDGWYEFNIANNGLFDILHGSFTKDGKVLYGKLADGGSNKIKQGKEVNKYGITCKGRTLILYINGYETRRLEDNQVVLHNGNVGVSVSSFNNVPVKVEFDSVQISEP